MIRAPGVFAPAVRGVLTPIVFNIAPFCVCVSLQFRLRFVRIAKALFSFPSFLAGNIGTHVTIIIVHSRLTPLYHFAPVLSFGLATISDAGWTSRKEEVPLGVWGLDQRGGAEFAILCTGNPAGAR